MRKLVYMKFETFLVSLQHHEPYQIPLGQKASERDRERERARERFITVRVCYNTGLLTQKFTVTMDSCVI